LLRYFFFNRSRRDFSTDDPTEGGEIFLKKFMIAPDVIVDDVPYSVANESLGVESGYQLPASLQMSSRLARRSQRID